MISNFSSLIELFAAIYLTICLDDLLLRRFWTPDYEEKVKKEFAKIRMPEIAKRPTLVNTSKYTSIEDSRSRKRGGLMFGYSMTLLIIIGFENYFKSLGQFGQAWLMISLIGAIIIVYLFDWFLLKSWWAVIKATIVIPAVIGVIAFFLPQLHGYDTFAEENHIWLVLLTQIFLVVTLVFPVFWQLIRNWLYTHYYLNYIVDQTKEKAADYNVALLCDSKKGHKVADVASVYHDAIVQAVAAGGGDRVITPFLKILESELNKIEYVPSLLPLVRYSIDYNKKHNPSDKKLKMLYEKYKTCNPLPKMDKFCKDNEVDLTMFRGYHQKQIERKES